MYYNIVNIILDTGPLNVIFSKIVMIISESLEY